MADMFADRLVKKIINEIIDAKGELPDYSQVWKSLTRIMFKRFPAHEVFNQIHEALAEASDEQWFEKKYPKAMHSEDWEYPKKKTSLLKKRWKNSKNRKIINENLRITDIAEDYGLEIKNGKALCPFHDDHDPSLSFSDDKNVFNCFGCGKKGDLVTFIRLMEGKKGDNKKGS